MRCLVVDDKSEDRALVERTLRKYGHHAIVVDDAAFALLVARSIDFEVAIVDLDMPGMSGLALISELRRFVPGLRLLVVSGFDDRRHVVDAFCAGADGYIVKTDVDDRLAASVEEIVAGASPLSSRVGAVLLRELGPR